MANIGLENAVLVFTGGYNTGKTTAALTYLPPSLAHRLYYLDGEGSGNRFVEQLARRNLAFGFYRNLDDRWRDLNLPGQADLLKRISIGSLPWAESGERDSMIEFYRFIVKDLADNLKPGEFDVFVFDPVARLEVAMQAWVEKNRDAAGWKRKGYGEMWRKGYYPLYRGIFTAIFERGVKVIILTAHLGSPWAEGGPIPGKVRPKAKPELFKLAQFYAWLVQEPANVHGEPAAVILKERLGTVGMSDNDTWNVQRKIPRRIPCFTWDNVAEYLEKGCNLAFPAPGEVPTAEEQAMIDDALSDKVLQLMLLRAQTAYHEARVQSGAQSLTDGEPDEPPEALAIRMAAQGHDVAHISDALNLPAPIIRSWLDA